MFWSFCFYNPAAGAMLMGSCADTGGCTASFCLVWNLFRSQLCRLMAFQGCCSEILFVYLAADTLDVFHRGVESKSEPSFSPDCLQAWQQVGVTNKLTLLVGQEHSDVFWCVCPSGAGNAEGSVRSFWVRERGGEAASNAASVLEPSREAHVT